MSDQDKIQRTVLPIPDPQYVGLTTYDAKDPDTKYPSSTLGAPLGGRSSVIGGYFVSGSLAS